MNPIFITVAEATVYVVFKQNTEMDTSSCSCVVGVKKERKI
ncbi:MAG: hypothetical protein ABIT08_06690 [Bacteroidia bacterium]